MLVAVQVCLTILQHVGRIAARRLSLFHDETLPTYVVARAEPEAISSFAEGLLRRRYAPPRNDIMTACLPPDSTSPTGDSIPAETATSDSDHCLVPTSATATLLAVPTYTGTPEISPGIGEATLSDDFSDPSLWDTAVSDQGSAAIRQNRLSLAVQPGVYLVSMRHDLTARDFYAELTARPSLCRGDDSYGILVRKAGQSFYRFSLSCSGQILAERIRGGVKLQLQEPILSGDAPRPPAEARIGIWAVGGEMRLFLNGRFQFSVNEGTLPSGELGVFVKSAGNDPVSVTFSDFKVYSVDYVPPTRTPIPG